jgi:tetratricopeptide (TPR) repeat protein
MYSNPTAFRRLVASIGVLVVLPSFALAQPAPTPAETQPAPQEGPARADLAPARELVRAQKFDEADRMLAELERSFPDDAALLLLRGEVLNASGKSTEAIPVLRRAAEVAPTKPRVGFALGAALATVGDSAGALAAFQKEIENNADPKVQALARINRSLMFQNQKQLAEAAQEIEHALTLDPDRRDAYGDLIDLYLQLQKPDDAAGAVDRAAAAGIRSARSAYRVGVAFFNQKAFDKSLPYFQSAVELQPDLAQAELALARALDKLGRSTEADPHLRKYLELQPSAPEAAEIRKRLKIATPATPAKK